MEKKENQMKIKALQAVGPRAEKTRMVSRCISHSLFARGFGCQAAGLLAEAQDSNQGKSVPDEQWLRNPMLLPLSDAHRVPGTYGVHKADPLRACVPRQITSVAN